MDRYEEAMNRMLQWEEEHPNGYVIEDMKKFVFPELKESEDERIRKELKEAFESYDIESKWNGIPIRSIFAWLEKQKEQKPAEWSEEDEAMLDSIISVVEDWEKEQSEEEKEYYGATSKSDWLKSLRPQPHWKPSKEQMEALGYAIEGKFDAIKPTSYLSRRLEDLEDDLRKLM